MIFILLQRALSVQCNQGLWWNQPFFSSSVYVCVITHLLLGSPFPSFLIPFTSFSLNLNLTGHFSNTQHLFPSFSSCISQHQGLPSSYCHPVFSRIFSAHPHPFSVPLLTSDLCSYSPCPHLYLNLFHFSCYYHPPSNLPEVSVKPEKGRDQLA